MTEPTACPNREGTAANHCWHATNTWLTTYPAINVKQCCFCGAELRQRTSIPDVPAGHGPHYPRPF